MCPVCTFTFFFTIINLSLYYNFIYIFVKLLHLQRDTEFMNYNFANKIYVCSRNVLDYAISMQ